MRRITVYEDSKWIANVQFDNNISWKDVVNKLTTIVENATMYILEHWTLEQARKLARRILKEKSPH